MIVLLALRGAGAATAATRGQTADRTAMTAAVVGSALTDMTTVGMTVAAPEYAVARLSRGSAVVMHGVSVNSSVPISNVP